MKNRALFAKILAVLALLAMPLAVAAQSNQGFNTDNPLANQGGGGFFSTVLNCPSGQGAVMCILKTVLLFLLTIAFIVALIFLVIGGFRYIVSQGNEEAIESAKHTITNAIIGVVVIALAWVVLNAILAVVATGNA